MSIDFPATRTRECSAKLLKIMQQAVTAEAESGEEEMCGLSTSSGTEGPTK